MPSVDELARTILRIEPKRRRRMVAIAGPPASGKSTLAEALVDRLNEAGTRAVLVPMDGFHLDNKTLKQRGLLPRKGAPETFDAQGFVELAKRAATDNEITFPVFDRAQDRAIKNAGMVLTIHDTVVFEGNYLLLERDPWRALFELWDYSTFISAPVELLRRRLHQRWADQGKSASEIQQKVERNDVLNVETVLNESRLETLDSVFGQKTN